MKAAICLLFSALFILTGCVSSKNDSSISAKLANRNAEAEAVFKVYFDHIEKLYFHSVHSAHVMMCCGDETGYKSEEDFAMISKNLHYNTPERIKTFQDFWVFVFLFKREFSSKVLDEHVKDRNSYVYTTLRDFEKILNSMYIIFTVMKAKSEEPKVARWLSYYTNNIELLIKENDECLKLFTPVN